MKENLDSIYVVNKPKHLIFTIINVDTHKFPITQKSHDVLSSLEKISDLGFIFPDSIKLVYKKFTSLYQGSSYMITKNLGAIPVLYMSEYVREIYSTRHTGIVIINASDLEEIDSDTILKIEKANMSILTRPIFEERRLSELEYYEIYKSITPAWYEKNKEDNSRMYSTHTSISPLLFFRPMTLKHIQNMTRESYRSTFTEEDPRYFFASVCKYLGIEIMDRNIKVV